MNTVARLSAYGAVVVLLGAGAYATGSAVDVPAAHLQPIARTGPAGHVGGHDVAAETGTSGSAPGAAQPSGLASTDAGAAPASGEGHTHSEGGHR